jgi:hypothetical protein
METPPRATEKEKGFGCGRVTLAVVLVLILFQLLVPFDNGHLTKGQLTQTLNNAREIDIATLRMETDGQVASNPKLGWPGDLPDVKTLSDFVERLMEYKYLDRGDLKSLFYAPGVKAYSGRGQFSSENSAFKIYKVTKADDSQVIFIATKNFTFGQALDPKAAPYGDKGAVIFRKGGEGVIVNDQQAKNSSNGNLGLMPGATSKDSPGTERDVLK